MEMKRLFLLLGTFFSALTLVVGVNAFVDPYLYWHHWQSEEWEPAFVSFDREVHLNLIAHVHPRAVLLGNSQTQYGLDPAHWTAPAPAINGSAVGVSLSDVRKMLDFSLAGGRVEDVVIGLDYGLTNRASLARDPMFESYVVHPDGAASLDNAKTLFSFSLFKSSLQSLRRRFGAPHLFAPDGHALDQLYVASTRGAGGARNSMRFRLRQFDAMLNDGGASEYKSDIRAMRDAACTAGAHLTLYLTPLHAVWIEALVSHGQDAAWEQWKRDIVSIAHERSGCVVTVWDFNYYNKFTTEPLPGEGVDASMTYSWDGVHFRPLVGDRILARMGETPPGNDNDFGFLLDPETVDAVILRERELRKDFIATHMADYEGWSKV